MKVLVTGATGQLGTAIAEQFGHHAEVHACGRPQLDLTDDDAVHQVVDRVRPEAIVNCAAYNDVDGAEDHPARAIAVNSLAVLSLADAAAAVGATLVHYSTDFVFDGAASEPYTEEDAPNPQSVYAMSKLMGEWQAARAPRHYVLRVESLFGGGARAEGDRRPGRSIDRIVDAILGGAEVRAFVDRVVSPSYIDDVAAATWHLLTSDAPTGLYHCVSDGWTTWYRLAQHAAALAGATLPISGIPMSEAHLRASRPRYAALANAKLRSVGAPTAHWQDALSRYMTRRLDGA